MRTPILAAALVLGALAGCKGEPDDTPWCTDEAEPLPPSAESLTYYRDTKPIIDQKCGRCHVAGGIGPFPLTTHADAMAELGAIKATINGLLGTKMPPWLAARCCAKYFHDFSLTDEEIAALTGWIDQGAAAGDPADEPPAPPPIGGLSRVDLVVEMAEPYTPQPPPGSTDDLRCFVADWPLDEPVFVTGLNPIPGARDVVHHLTIAVVAPGSVEEVMGRDGADGRPGFECTGGAASIDLRDVTVLGGSLLGGDFPRGLGTRVEPGSKVVFDMHYSTVMGTTPDRTKVEVRVDSSASRAKGIALANPAWLAGGAMAIPAGEKDTVYYYRLEPDFFTRDEPVMIESVMPHMHAFGSKIVVRIIHADDRRTCLLEIPDWHFGWAQPFWLDEPIRMEADDELYIECHFDNSAANQPNGAAPRDIAWGGNNQDMCAAFVAFTDVQ
jgi:hypothetical protein